MKKTLMLLGLVILLTCSYAQNYITRTAHINVKSANKVQNIVADNYQVACQLNAQTGQLKIIALIKSFEYQIGAMNRVMNTRDMDVSDYPKITFDGKIEKINQLDLTKPGSYPVHLKGLFYVWDENAPAEVDGFLTTKADGSLELKTNFTVAVERLDVKKIDMIMRQKLPVSLNLPANSLGISKNVQINALAILKKQ
jgi:hypothetical protein